MPSSLLQRAELLPFLSRIIDKDPKSLTFKSSGSMSNQKHPSDVYLGEKIQRKYTRMIEGRSESFRQATVTFVTNKKARAGKPLSFDDCIINVRLAMITIVKQDTVVAMLEPYCGVSVRELRADTRSIESKTCQRELDCNSC